MGAGREKKESVELFATPTSVKVGKHKTFIKSLLEKGYKIESEEKTEETGLSGEVISETEIVILRPADHDWPMLKFEAKEKFGSYNYDEGTFDEWEDSNFEVRSYQKSANIMRNNDPWKMIDM